MRYFEICRKPLLNCNSKAHGDIAHITPYSSRRALGATRPPRRLASTAKETGKAVCLWLGLVTELRRGEALALRWKDVDLDNGTLSVHFQYGKRREPKAPKSRKSAWTIRLDGGGTVAYLKDWKEEQAKLLERMKKRRYYTDGDGDRRYDAVITRKAQTGSTPVYTNDEGGYISPDRWPPRDIRVWLSGR